MLNPLEQVKVAICIPSQGMWHADFGMSFSQMAVFMACNLFKPGQERSCIVLEKRSSMLPQSREEALEDAEMQGCTHALFVDTDQTFPADLCHRLIAHGKPVVACNVALKVHPSFPTARLRGPTPYGIPLTSGPEKHGLEKVWRVGSGVMLLEMATVKKLKRPRFELRWSDEGQRYVGEDWYLCEKLEQAGIDIYIDHDTSRMIGHVGQYTFTHGDIPLVEQAKAA